MTISESILKPVGMTGWPEPRSAKRQVAQCVQPGEVGAAFNEEPRWDCNIREIVATTGIGSL